MSGFRGLLIASTACGRIAFDPLGDAAPGELPVIDTNIVFLTPPTMTPGAFGGLAGADAECQMLATQAGLPGTYVAFLSTSTVRAIDRLAGARGWRRPDGAPFVDTSLDILTGRVYSIPIVDATGARPGSLNGSVPVVTGTAKSGDPSIGLMCNDYTSTAGLSSIGTASATRGSFIYFASGSCGAGQRIYCFGIDRNVALAPRTPTSTSDRRAFLSSPWIPGGGLAAADAHCQADALAAGITGTFKALLATSTASAASRFSTTGAPWMRLDGIRIASTANALLGDTRLMLEPLNLTAAGAYIENYVWTGSNNVFSPGLQNCSDWTVNMQSQDGDLGWASLADANWFYDLYIGLPSQSCDQMASVYCLEP